MRVTRGLLASLGASGCMAAAGACALLAISAAIGVRGWPGLSAGTVSVQTISARAAAPRPAPRERLGGGAAAPVARTAAHHILAATEAAPTDLPSAPGAAHAASPAQRPAPAVASAPAPASRPATPPAATPAVPGVSAEVGKTVAPVSPQAAQVVTQAGDTAGGVLDRLPTP